MKSRISGDEIKCFISGDAQKALERCDIGDIWSKRRISIFGLIYYKGPLKISKVEVTEIRFFKSRSELPSIDDIIAFNFTGGLMSEKYLDRLRNGKLS